MASHSNVTSKSTERTPLLGRTDTATSDSSDDSSTVFDIETGLLSPVCSHPKSFNFPVSSNATINPPLSRSVTPEDRIPTKIVIILAVARIGSFLAALDMTILATLSGPISASFNSLSLFSWIASAYMVATSACQPISGKLTDIYGRRAGLVVSNALFGLGTLLCGLAPNAEMVIAGRVVAGIGGAGMSTIAGFLTADFVPLRSRPLWQCMNSVSYLLGTGIGGLFGGAIADALSWRWAFFLQLPIVVLSILLIWFLLNIPCGPSAENKPSLKRVDFIGSVLLLASMVLFLLGLNAGGSQLPWSHPLVIVALVGGGVSFAIFCYVETHPSIAPEPVMPVSIMIRSRTIIFANLVSWFSSMPYMIVLYYLPVYLLIRGERATEVGYRTIPVSAAVAVASVVTSVVIKTTGRYKPIGILSCIIFIAGAGLMLLYDLHTADWKTYILTIPTGFGYGLIIPAAMISVMAATDQAHQAVVLSANYAFRSTGNAVGIAIASAVFQNVLSHDLNRRYGKSPQTEKTIENIRDSFEWMKNPPKGWDVDVIKDAYMESITATFWTGLVLAILTGLCMLGLKEHVLKKKM